MDPMKNLDLAQLRTLRTVFRLNSFSAAAQELGQTQSSVSYAIARLREAFGDPLFVRQGGGIAATARCREIVDATARMLDELSALGQAPDFDPATAAVSLTISCNAYERFIVIPPLVRHLRRHAPGVRLDIITAYTQGNRHLLDGVADLLIGPLFPTESGIYSEALMNDRYVCVTDPNNPLAGQALDQASYLAANHVLVTYGGAWKSPYLVQLEREGHRLARTIGTPSPADLPVLLDGTDLIGTVPSRLARHFGPSVAVTPCPFPAPVDIHMFWAARSHTAPTLRWLRGLLQDLTAEIGPA